MKRTFFLSIVLMVSLMLFQKGITYACTGISLRSVDGSYIQARTIEWSGSALESMYVIVPRGEQFTSYTPTGVNGLSFKAKYGMVGIAVVQKEFIAEGINEKGLSAGLFYFPGYGKYPLYNQKNNSKTISDLQLTTWMLSQFSSVEEVIAAIDDVFVTTIQGDATVHWRIGDSSGRQVVLEYKDGRAMIYENQVGVITNSPDFHWQVTNLNNYVNLYPGNSGIRQYNDHTVAPFGAGSGFLGLPGDFTPASRFVRAFFLSATAVPMNTALESVIQSFKILNNFDIPIGVLFEKGKAPDIPSATQWTSSIDLTNRRVYYRTMYNSSIRCIDLSNIDFAKTKFIVSFLDEQKSEPINKIL